MTGHNTRISIDPNKKKYPPWYTRAVIRTLKAKERERRKLKRGKTPIDDGKYRSLRTASKKQIKAAYSEYLTRTEENLAVSPHTFWNIIKQKRESEVSSGVKKYADQTYDTPGKIAEVFAEYFSSVYVQNTLGSISPAAPSVNSDIVSLHAISGSQVLQTLKNLKPKRSLGPDKIPAYIYRACREHLAPPPRLYFQFMYKE